MKRFNYLGRGNAAPARRIATTLAIDNRVRGPLAALAAIVLFTAAIAAVQLSRLHTAQTALTISAIRLATSERDVASLRILQRDTDVQARLVRRLNDSRSQSLMNIAHVVWVGNHLPHDTWLRSLRFENGTYSLDGTAARMAAIGNAIIALRSDSQSGVPQLVSIRNDSSDRNARIQYVLRLEQQP